MTLRPPERVNLDGTDTGDRDCLSHSRLGVFLSCQEKFNWHYEHRLEPAVKKPALTMGSAFAHALETGDPQAGFNQVIEERDALLLEHSGDPWIVIPSLESAEIDATIVLATAGAYLKRYGTQDVRREVTFRARIRNPQTGAYSRTFDVQARVDGLTPTGLVEDKLVGRIDHVTERKLILDRQVTLGCYMAWRCEGLDIHDVLYRMTKKPAIKRTQKETHDEYLARIVSDYAERPDFYLQEFRLERTPEDFLRLEHELWQWCSQIREARHAGVFPRNTASCSEYGGCKFLGLCTREPGARDQFVVRPERDQATSLEKREKEEATA